MNHIHFDQIHSTQSYLVDKYSELSGDVLISCDTQSSGRGQYSRIWDSQNGGIYLSCLLDANPTISLSSLEMGVLLTDFCEQKFKVSLKLKWPNDILTHEAKKCAGILINNPGGKKLVVGIGVNLINSIQKNEYSTPIGHVLNKKYEYSQKKLSLEIYQFILTHRLTPPQTIERWSELCIHTNKEVQLIDCEKTYTGIFKGIGPMGEALIEQESMINKFYTGSLTFRV